MVQMAYEVFVRSWRPMNLNELIGAIHALCAASPQPKLLADAMSADPRFTFDGLRYALDEFRWHEPGDFCYIDPRSLA